MNQKYLFRKLINQPIASIKYDEDLLSFNLSSGEVISFYAWGDCCSKSFIESIDDPDIFKDAVFISATHEMDRRVDMNADETFEWSFYKFVTSKGMTTLSFRNESNGYYSGALQEVRK